MKPNNWDLMAMEDRIDIGNELYHSLRGRYILGQALSVAIKSMKTVPMPHREVSNIQDMEILRETVFTLPCQQDLGPEMFKRMREAYAGVK